MRIVYVNGSVLKSPPLLPIVHTISFDCHVEKGAPKLLNRKYKFRPQLWANRGTKCPAVVGVHTKNKLIVTLFTKWSDRAVTTLQDMRDALYQLREWLVCHNIFCWAAFELGCGLDRPEDLYALLHEVFGNNKMVIYMYHLRGCTKRRVPPVTSGITYDIDLDYVQTQDSPLDLSTNKRPLTDEGHIIHLQATEEPTNGSQEVLDLSISKGSSEVEGPAWDLSTRTRTPMEAVNVE